MTSTLEAQLQHHPSSSSKSILNKLLLFFPKIPLKGNYFMGQFFVVNMTIIKGQRSSKLVSKKK
jgi:hypothetical protein